MSDMIYDDENTPIEVDETYEELEFIIEDDDEDEESSRGGFVHVPPESRRKRWTRRLLKAGALLLAAALSYAAYDYWQKNVSMGVSISVSPSENIEKLQQPAVKETAEVVLTSDTVMGIVLDFYEIHGLKANIEFQEPDPSDKSVYLYSRCADIREDSSYIGSLVVDGEEKQNDNGRWGYMAMVGDRMVIGVSRSYGLLRSDLVKDYCVKNGGSFFRQFVLVSDGGLPNRFQLHGKKERCAIGRIGERLYFIATRDEQTLFDFADAIRRYGFDDAIYITGGKENYSYFRDRKGRRHDIGDPSKFPFNQWKGIIPWLVMRKME